MVSVQADCTVDEARDRIVECARSMGQTVDHIVTAVLDRQLRFAPAA